MVSFKDAMAVITEAVIAKTANVTASTILHLPSIVLLQS